MYRVRKFENKYKSVPTEVNGITYHSKLEGKYAFELDARKRSGDIKDWERQVKVSLDVNGYHIANYYCDFLVHHHDGTREYVEVKGRFLLNNPVFVMKRKLLEATFIHDNPTYKYTIVVG